MEDAEVSIGEDMEKAVVNQEPPERGHIEAIECSGLRHRERI